MSFMLLQYVGLGFGGPWCGKGRSATTRLSFSEKVRMSELMLLQASGCQE